MARSELKEDYVLATSLWPSVSEDFSMLYSPTSQKHNSDITMMTQTVLANVNMQTFRRTRLWFCEKNPPKVCIFEEIFKFKVSRYLFFRKERDEVLFQPDTCANTVDDSIL